MDKDSSVALMHYDQSDLGSPILIRNVPKERNLMRLPSSQFLHEAKAKKKKLAEKSTFSSSQLDSDPFKKMYVKMYDPFLKMYV